MKVVLHTFLLILLSSCEDINSNSADKLKYSKQGPQPEEAQDPNFAPAFKVIQNNCISCHTGFHNRWASYTTNDKWIASGRINRGDPDNSRIIERTINSGQTGANMPIGGGPLSDADYQLLRTWITNIP